MTCLPPGPWLPSPWPSTLPARTWSPVSAGFTPDGKLIGQHLTACEDGPLPLNDILDLDGGWNAGQFFYQPEVMFTRSLWLRAGGYVDETMYFSMDYDLWARFADAGARLHVIGRPVAWFRLHEEKDHVQEKFVASYVGRATHSSLVLGALGLLEVSPNSRGSTCALSF